MTDGPWRTIPELVADSARRYADMEALVEGPVRKTFAELAADVDRVARAMMAAGVERGDRVAIWAPNWWEWPVVALGVHTAGGVVVPVNTRFKGEEARYVLAKSRARMLCTTTDFLGVDYVALLHEGADAAVPAGLRDVVVLRGPVTEGTIALDELVLRADEVAPDALAARVASITADDLCHIMFTSGTTGAPKGAMLAHGPVCKAYDAWCEVVGLRPGDRYLIVNPYFHSFGLNAGILACLMRGATNVPHPVFDVPALMRRVVEERITMFPGPPAAYQTMLNDPDLPTYDLSTLRLAVTGAAAIPVDLVHRMRAELGFETIVTGYGLTETSGIATMCRHDDDAETIATTSGRAIPGIEVRVVDDDGRELPRGRPGEIVIRGYNVMRGYYDDAVETAVVIDDEGWLHSGDIGTMDERGNVVITDRKKDMFIVGGFNAYPAEIEGFLSAHPDVAQVAVIGIPDERLGEVGMAFVVPRHGATVDPDELIAWARHRMANYKVPRRVAVVDELPLNAAGKVVKDVLRARAADAGSGDPGSGDPGPGDPGPGEAVRAVRGRPTAPA